ncbi:MAG: hypothetical protein KKF12_01465 [Proteobacteria bacterium]|nr:hypothetical protein [Pseudomonadota bacterium]
MTRCPKRNVFTDASSAILLYKADLFAGLAETWQVVMAPAVFSEITKSGYPGADFFKRLGRKTKNRAPVILLPELPSSDSPLFAQKNFIAMGKGEKETICLYLRSTCRAPEPKGTGAFILVDDGRAVKICRAHQIPFINALLVPKIFWYSGGMDQKEYLEKTDRLCGLGRYTKTIKQMAEHFSKEDLDYFIGGNTHDRY